MKDLFRNIANRHTSEIALIFGKQSATYQELDILSNKIAQLIIKQYLAPPLEVVEELEKTDRGDAGFGSTGR